MKGGQSVGLLSRLVIFLLSKGEEEGCFAPVFFNRRNYTGNLVLVSSSGVRQQTDMSALRRGREGERIARGRRSATVGCHSKRLRFLGKGDRSLSVAVFPRFPTEMNQERGKNGIKTYFFEKSGKCPSLKSPP